MSKATHHELASFAEMSAAAQLAEAETNHAITKKCVASGAFHSNYFCLSMIWFSLMASRAVALSYLRCSSFQDACFLSHAWQVCSEEAAAWPRQKPRQSFHALLGCADAMVEEGLANCAQSALLSSQRLQQLKSCHHSFARATAENSGLWLRRFGDLQKCATTSFLRWLTYFCEEASQSERWRAASRTADRTAGAKVLSGITHIPVVGVSPLTRSNLSIFSCASVRCLWRSHVRRFL